MFKSFLFKEKSAKPIEENQDSSLKSYDQGLYEGNLQGLMAASRYLHKKVVRETDAAKAEALHNAANELTQLAARQVKNEE